VARGEHAHPGGGVGEATTAEVLVLLEPAAATFEHHAALALERAPGAPAVHTRRHDAPEPAASSEPQRE
jgi:hypothetical protein